MSLDNGEQIRLSFGLEPPRLITPIADFLAAYDDLAHELAIDFPHQGTHLMRYVGIGTREEEIAEKAKAGVELVLTRRDLLKRDADGRPVSVAEWNRLAVLYGRSGLPAGARRALQKADDLLAAGPLTERLAVAMRGTQRHLKRWVEAVAWEVNAQ